MSLAGVGRNPSSRSGKFSTIVRSFEILWTDFYNVDALCFFLFSVKEYIALGLDKEIIDPDNGANIARKLETLRSSGVDLSKHPNLVPSPPYPDEGWTTVLADYPPPPPPPPRDLWLRLPALRCAQHERSLHICDCGRGTCSSNCCHATARSHRCCHALATCRNTDGELG